MGTVIDQAISKANQRLRGGGIVIEARPQTNTLYLRGKLPPKPKSGQSEPYRQRIHLVSESTGRGVKATLPAVEWATQEAQRLSLELSSGEFQWSRWDTSVSSHQSPYTLIEIWDQWIDFKSATVAQTTLRKDYSRFRRHLANFGDPTPEDAISLRDWVISKLSPKTGKRMLTLLSAACGWGVERKLCDRNPFASMASTIQTSVKEQRVDPFTRAEISQIIQSFDEHRTDRQYASFIRFLFLTGCRISEAVGLRWKSVYPTFIVFEEAVVDGQRKDTKTHKSRRFPVSGKLKDLLTEIRPPEAGKDAPVFLSPTGKLIDPHNFVTRYWKRSLERAGVRYRYQYQTRHTFIAFALSEGVSAAQVAEWVGNSVEMIARNYAGVFEPRKVPELF